jgi:hypothetical protein
MGQWQAYAEITSNSNVIGAQSPVQWFVHRQKWIASSNHEHSGSVSDFALRVSDRWSPRHDPLVGQLLGFLHRYRAEEDRAIAV